MKTANAARIGEGNERETPSKRHFLQMVRRRDEGRVGARVPGSRGGCGARG